MRVNLGFVIPPREQLVSECRDYEIPLVHFRVVADDDDVAYSRDWIERSGC
jgi:hypothetical protein